MFFINSGKKIFRIAGIAVAALLGLLCLLMIVTSAAFGSAGTVGVFGFNMFICDSDDYDSVPAGSAVISTSCAPYDLEEGNLVLYTTDPSDKNAPLAMGYYSDFKMTDGVYYLQLVNGSDATVISEDAIIGRAGWCSPFLGVFISFTKSPWGVLVMAVLPCAILVLCDLLRVKTEEKPIPEIIPQVKNQPEDDRQPQISVNASGSAAYRRNAGAKSPTSADSVLFTYDTPKKPRSEVRPSTPTMSDADVLALLNAPSPKAEKPQERPAFLEKPQKTAQTADRKPQEKPTLPAPVAAKRYIDNTIAPAVSQEHPAQPEKATVVAGVNTKMPEKNKASGKTAELPELPKPSKKRGDAFFAQSEVPQIGKGFTGRQNAPRSSSRSIIDLEDALAAAPSRASRPESRRSADILAAKNRSDLITEDDDSRDKSRYEVDDILAGIEKRHQQ